LKIDHIEEIEALSREAIGDDHKARALTRAIVRAQEHWHQEAKEILATKEDLHTQTWGFLGLVSLMTTIFLGVVYYVTNDLKSEVREIRNTVNAINARLPK
jgi:CO dehydrogenase/acetyl-CoA synthase epsilon subunit